MIIAGSASFRFSRPIALWVLSVLRGSSLLSQYRCFLAENEWIEFYVEDDKSRVVPDSVLALIRALWRELKACLYIKYAL
jgi:hypothetical protein